MAYIRAQALVVQNSRVLFGYGKGIHYFIGGTVEEGETVEEAAIRELREEANVNGTILFRLSQEVFPNTVTFLVDIQQQVTRLGYDPEEIETDPLKKQLAGIEFIPLDRLDSFTAIDIEYFVILMAECRRRGIDFPWLEIMNFLIKQKIKRNGDN
jgi:8-oxo-dGTP pyrophosphatase MutT (NUDIX family)